MGRGSTNVVDTISLEDSGKTASDDQWYLLCKDARSGLFSGAATSEIISATNDVPGAGNFSKIWIKITHADLRHLRRFRSQHCSLKEEVELQD